MTDHDKSKWDFSEYELYCMTLSKFEMIEKLGEGSMGDIHLAQYKPTGRLYALKLVEYENKQTVLAGLDISIGFNHKNLVKCYGYFSEQYKGKKYLISVMEFVQGRDFHDILTDNNPKYIFKILPNVLEQIIDGLSYLHGKGYVHRDIKLENIILSITGIVKILDYDFVVETNMICYVETCGTPYYVSPEILKGIFTDNRTDLWSLGVFLYILLTNYYPFDGEDEVELYSQIVEDEPDIDPIPLGYRAIVSGLLAKSPYDRISLEQVSILLKGL